jgi:hypothetical protein
MLATFMGLSCLALIVSAAPVWALTLVAPPAIPLRTATADAVIVGKATGFGPKLVPAERFPGDKGEFQIATVKVDETLLGKPVKEIKVAFLAPPAPGGPGRPIIGGMPRINLAIDQEVCLFLTKHPTKDFYVINAYYDVLNKKSNPNFPKDTDEVKRAAKLLKDPRASLKSKKAEDRFLTAAMLITRYRTQKFGNIKTEEVPAAESKLILTALAEADWTPPKPGTFQQVTPQMVFYRLGLTPADGWVQPKDFREMPKEAKKWLQANAGKYRIKRYMTAKEKK